MNCIDVASKLSLFIDNELPFGEREEICQHLMGCPPCDQRYDDELTFRNVLRDKLFKKCCTEAIREGVKDVVHSTAY